MDNFEKPDLDELNILYNEDQKDRREKLWRINPELMSERDSHRLERVLNLVNNDGLKKPEDFLHAAMILQHGSETYHYELAHKLAQNAAAQGYIPEIGEVDPLWLAAAAKDRALMSQGKPQLYGTQSRKDAKDGLWYLYEVDPNITDEERAKFHVEPLSEAQKRVKDLNASNEY